MKKTDLVKQQNALSDRGQTVAVIGSATWAAKARDALATASIRADVIKVSSQSKHGGCIYGIRFASAQKSNVFFVLGRAGISVREYLESDV